MESIGWTLLAGAGGTCLAILMFALVAGYFVRAADDIPDRREIRRSMFLGLYCNPRDRRFVVPRPSGSGWTINFRSENVATVLWLMLLLIPLAIVLLIFGPAR
jgi:hypothetical protein